MGKRYSVGAARAANLREAFALARAAPGAVEVRTRRGVLARFRDGVPTAEFSHLATYGENFEKGA
jgi:hypothetical protein